MFWNATAFNQDLSSWDVGPGWTEPQPNFTECSA